MNKNKLISIATVTLLIILAGCSEAEKTTPTPVSAPASAPTPSSTPAVEPTAPARATTTPPPGASTVSSEMIGGTSDCDVKGDCITYIDTGIPTEKCAYYDDVGCYHHYACAPSGEAVQKETPAFCGR